jgi:hypothetical protein
MKDKSLVQGAAFVYHSTCDVQLAIPLFFFTKMPGFA